MSNKLTFDYNNIRKLTGNLKSNLRDKYKSLESITSGINNVSDGGYQYSSLQVSESDKYIDELSLLFENNTLDGNYKINGKLTANTIEVENIIIKNDNKSDDKYDINKIIELIKLQDLKLSKQTIDKSVLNEITVNNSYLYSSIINDSVLNRCSFNNIRSINGLVGINNSNPLYDLDVNGSSRLGQDSSGISHIEFGYVTLSAGSAVITCNSFGMNPIILLSYLDGPRTTILYTSGILSPSFTINGEGTAKVSWILIE